MTNIYTVREFGHLQPGDPKDERSTLSDRIIPLELWDALKVIVHDGDGEDTKGVLYPAADAKNGTRRLKVRNYIGVLATDYGAIEILPKLAQTEQGNADEEMQGLRTVVKTMLAAVLDLPFQKIGEAGQDRQDDTLFEWFILAFLNKVLYLVRMGLRSAYENVDDNLPVLRGRLALTQHLRVNIADASRFYVRFDEFTPNRPENKLLLSALHKAWRASRSQSNRRLAKELMFAFADVEESRNIAADFRAWRSERGAGHYKGLLGWCRAVLKPYSAAPSAGEMVFDSFLFPADKLFEAYVAERLRRSLVGRNEFSINTQVSGKSLFGGRNHGNLSGPFGRRYDLRPDIVITRNVGTSKEVLICDTKWKLYEDDNAQVSQADLYQLYAYAKYWAAGAERVQVALIAPCAKKLSVVTGPHRYGSDQDDHEVDLWMVPYDLQVNIGSIPIRQNQTALHDSLLGVVIQAHHDMINDQ